MYNKAQGQQSERRQVTANDCLDDEARIGDSSDDVRRDRCCQEKRQREQQEPGKGTPFAATSSRVCKLPRHDHQQDAAQRASEQREALQRRVERQKIDSCHGDEVSAHQCH